MSALPTFLRNRKNLTLIFFGLFFVSVMTNVALLRQPNPVSVQNVTRLERQVETQQETIANLNAELSDYRTRLSRANDELRDLEDRLASMEESQNQDTLIPRESNPTPRTPVDSIDSQPADSGISENTNFTLEGEGCNFAPSSNTGAQANKVCNLVDADTGTVLTNLIDCGRQKFFIYPAGSEGICAQGAEIVLGKKDPFNLYIVNLATAQGAGQNLQPYGYSLRTGELQAFGSFFAAPRVEGVSEDGNIRDLGKQFADAYKQYVADELPAEYLRDYYVYE